MKENEKIEVMKEFKVLIVDDVPENIQVLAHLLNEKGLKVSYADSGIKALKAIKNNLPDLILLDVSMPGMDGLEVCEKLKKDEITSDIPVIFLTARVDQQDVINGLEKGAVDYVTKPFNAKELIKRVFTHLELKYTRDIIRKQNEELIKLNEVKNQLFSVISHDMKNLFNNILFGTESLEKEIEHFSKENVAQMAGVINDSAKRAYDLLQNLLDWSRSQMDNIAIKPTEVEMLMLVNQSVTLFRPSTQKKKLIIEVFPEGNDFSAFADIDMVRTILRNLLSNAIKYSFPEGQIDISVIEFPDVVKVSIKDHGVGMDKEQLQRLLDANQPARSSPGTQNEKGSGLGLVLIKDFVAKNKGTFGIESEKGKGSTFWFSLPRQKDQ
jgi:two-component system, sensor histidine kinase and response regulator